MGEDTSQIERDIVIERAELGRNLEDLEQKARELTDWRVHYSHRPAVFLGAALGTGLVLGALTGGGHSHRPRSARVVGIPPKRPLTERSPKAAHVASTWGHISDALLGLATAKAIDVIADYLPGFRDQYERQSAPASHRETSTPAF